MITKDELQELFASTETYRIERTVSTTDKDKFGEAVCAFANDMPDSGKPGYLLIGVRNDGSLNEHPFKGPIVRMLAQIDLFIETTVARKRPVFVTALREETRTDYPKAAIRELVMNAIMHRDYQGNAPIHFYQYADRLEIVNHGGLYGRARPENFPNVSDYRNPIIAEAMKVLGYVNCYNRGINMVQDELEANGNGKAEFSFRLITAFEAKVALAGKGEGGVSPENDPINDPMLPESGTMNGTIDGTMALRIVRAIEKDPSVTMDQLSEKLGVARRSLVRYMNILQDNKRIKRVGGKRFGHWEVLA